METQLDSFKLIPRQIYYIFLCLFIYSCNNFPNKDVKENEMDSLQWHYSEKYPSYDSIRYINNQIYVKINKNHMIYYRDIDVNGVHLFASENDIYLSFGKPDSLKSIYNDVCSKPIKNLYYANNILKVIDEKFLGFEINNRNCKIKGISIAIGDSCSKLNKYLVNNCCESNRKVNLNFNRITSHFIFIKDTLENPTDDRLHVLIKNCMIEKIIYDPCLP